MIVFDLECRAGGHRFDGWFGSSEDFAAQQRRGLINCPQCRSGDVGKAPMAPRLTRKANQIGLAGPPRATPAAPANPVAIAAPTPAPRAAPAIAGLPAAAAAMLQAMARMQAQALKTSHWVGDQFADDARAMHYGEKDQAAIHGQATAAQAQDLLDEGIEIAPILFPLGVPGRVN